MHLKLAASHFTYIFHALSITGEIRNSWEMGKRKRAFEQKRKVNEEQNFAIRFAEYKRRRFLHTAKEQLHWRWDVEKQNCKSLSVWTKCLTHSFSMSPFHSQQMFPFFLCPFLNTFSNCIPHKGKFAQSLAVPCLTCNICKSHFSPNIQVASLGFRW